MEEKDIYTELSSIRNLMERSSKFISLSGLSGIMAGIYALVGAYIGYKFFYIPATNYQEAIISWLPVIIIALLIIATSLLTGVWLTYLQAKKKKENFWNPVSKRLLINSFIPLCTGGIFIIIQLINAQYSLIASSCLLFYGLALIAGSQYTFTDVKYLGYSELLLGFIAALNPLFSFICWIIGFGLLHIVYGSVMHFKYKQ